MKTAAGTLAITILVLLNGCTHYVVDETPAKSFRAEGFGAMPVNDTAKTPGQQKLLAMRASKIDAYRNLAERVYGLRVDGNTSVSDFMATGDGISEYVGAVLKGTRVVSTETVDEETYKTVVELDLPPRFFGCVNATTRVGSCFSPVTSRCFPGGCDQYDYQPVWSRCSGANCTYTPSQYYYTDF